MESDDPTTEKPKRSRRDRFVQVAERRTKRVLKEIVMLSNCSNKNAYEFTETDVHKIFGAIDAEIKKAQDRFIRPDRKKGVDFTLAG